MMHCHQAPVLMLKVCGPHFEKQVGSELGLGLSSFNSSSVAGPVLGHVGDSAVIEAALYPAWESGRASCRRRHWS